MMSAQAVFHVTLLGTAAHLAHLSTTPPTPVPPKGELAKLDQTMVVRFLARFARYMCSGVRLVNWASTGSTIAVVIAREYPSKIGRRILRTLLADSAAVNHIRPSPAVVTGAVLTIAGAAIRLACYRALDNLFTFEVTVRQDHRLCTRGPYAVVRHPSYAGWCLQTAGLALCHLGAGSWMRESGLLRTPAGAAVASAFVGSQVALALAMVFSRCRSEDAVMRQRFGRAWDYWAERVPYRMFPLIY